MKTDYDAILFWFERARRTFREGELLAANKLWNASVNRLYYACFYALCALFKQRGFSTKKHSGVRSMFFHHYVKTGHVPKDLGDLYRRLFEGRNEGDYIEYVEFSEETVLPWIPRTKTFIEFIEQLTIEEMERPPE